MDFDRFKKINDEKMNQGELAGATAVATYRNLGCGDGYRIYLRVEDGVIRDASYTTEGCGFGLVALAMITELVKGKTLAEAEKITPEDIDRAFTFPDRRKNYPTSAWEAMHLALKAARTGSQPSAVSSQPGAEPVKADG